MFYSHELPDRYINYTTRLETTTPPQCPCLSGLIVYFVIVTYFMYDVDCSRTHGGRLTAGGYYCVPGEILWWLIAVYETYNSDMLFRSKEANPRDTVVTSVDNSKFP